MMNIKISRIKYEVYFYMYIKSSGQYELKHYVRCYQFGIYLRMRLFCMRVCLKGVRSASSGCWSPTARPTPTASHRHPDSRGTKIQSRRLTLRTSQVKALLKILLSLNSCGH